MGLVPQVFNSSARANCLDRGPKNSRHLKKLLVDQLQRIHALLELDVFIGELGAVFGLAQLLFNHLLRARSEGRKVRTISQSNKILETCQQEGGRSGGVFEQAKGGEG